MAETKSAKKVRISVKTVEDDKAEPVRTKRIEVKNSDSNDVLGYVVETYENGERTAVHAFDASANAIGGDEPFATRSRAVGAIKKSLKES